jgi:threonine dehydrogenase-like Zn-dependent dehydrogenase
MKTVRLEEPGRLALVDTEPPAAPARGEALVRVRRVGVCGTDLHAFGGSQPFFSYPRILGHELGVEVIAAGPGVDNVKAGDRCSVEPYLNCGACIACRRGRPNCCTGLRVLGVHMDGGMREEFVVPARKLHPSASLNLDQLALVETLAIGCHAVERAAPVRGRVCARHRRGADRALRHAVRVGGGRAGHRARRQRRPPRLLQGRSMSRTPSTRPPRIPCAACSGSPAATSRPPCLTPRATPRSMAAAFDYPAHGRKLVFVGLFQGEVAFSDPNFHRRELTLLASRNALPADFTRIIGLIESRPDRHGAVDHPPLSPRGGCGQPSPRGPGPRPGSSRR